MTHPRLVQRGLRLAGAAACLLACVWGLSFEVRAANSGASEPQVMGRPLSSWLSDYGYNGDVHTTEEVKRNAAADMAVRQLGTNALGEIWRLVTNSAPRSDSESKSPNSEDFMRVLYALDALGPVAAPLVPRLQERLRLPSAGASQRAALMLLYIGPPALPALMQASTNSDPQVRRIALLGFTRFGTNSTEVLASAAKALQDSDHAVRRQALWAISESKRATGNAAVAMSTLLTDPHEACRSDAAEALSSFASIPDQAKRALVKALDDPAASVRHRAAAAVRRLAPESAGLAVTSLCADLNSPDTELAREAIEELVPFGAAARQALPLLQAIATNATSTAVVAAEASEQIRRQMK